MNKYAAWLCLASTCTLGCKNVVQRTAYFAPSTQASTAKFPEQGLPVLAERPQEVDVARVGSANAKDAEKEHGLTQSTSKESTSPPAASQKEKETVAVAGILAGGAHRALNTAPVVGPVVESETADSRSVASTFMTATIPGKNVEEQGNIAYQQVGTLRADRAPQQDVSTKIWYGIASIGGAIFTCIFAPLVVDFIKLRLACGRRQPDANRTIKIEETDQGENGQNGVSMTDQPRKGPRS